MRAHIRPWDQRKNRTVGAVIREDEMSKHGELKLCLLVLLFVFSLIPTAAAAQEGCIAPTVTKEVKDIERYLGLAWSPANPDTIQQDTSAKVKVTGGLPPLAWSVSGTGFSLEKVQGQNSVDHERSKLLKASPTSCGTATITVTDTCGDKVTGYVRGEDGRWEKVSEGNCAISGDGELIDTIFDKESVTFIYTYELISGKTKQLQKTVVFPGCEIWTVEDCPQTLRDCPDPWCSNKEDDVCEDRGEFLDVCCITHDNCIDPTNTFPINYVCWVPIPGAHATAWFSSCVSILEEYQWNCAE